MPGFLEDCFRDGVLPASGASSGRDCAGRGRLSYRALPPDRMDDPIDRLARRMR